MKNQTNLNPQIFRNYLYSNKYWNSDVFLLLQGRDNNIRGTVIGFLSSWRKNYQGEKDDYSCLLFFDHCTAKIEKYLVNIQFTESTFNKDFFDYPDRAILNHYLPDSYRYKDEISNGKIDENFLTIFLTELLEDYLINNKSSFDTNLARIIRDGDENNNFYTPKTITKNNVNKNNIVIPNKLNLQVLKSKFKHYPSFNFIHHGKSSYPYAVFLIKKFICCSPYHDIEELSRIIDGINDLIAEQVYLINTDPEARDNFMLKNIMWEYFLKSISNE